MSAWSVGIGLLVWIAGFWIVGIPFGRPGLQTYVIVTVTLGMWLVMRSASAAPPVLAVPQCLEVFRRHPSYASKRQWIEDPDLRESLLAAQLSGRQACICGSGLRFTGCCMALQKDMKLALGRQ